MGSRGREVNGAHGQVKGVDRVLVAERRREAPWRSGIWTLHSGRVGQRRAGGVLAGRAHCAHDGGPELTFGCFLVLGLCPPRSDGETSG